MIRFLRYLPYAALTMLLAACGDDSEYFYTTSYPVVRVDATVTLKPVAPPDTGGETGDETGGESGGETGEETGGETPVNPLIQQIKDDVIANAPVQAGGSYRLAFKYFDSGRLTVRPASDAETLSGGFLKQPGATQIEFFFADHAITYTIDTYTSQEGLSATLLTADLTEQYQALYPDAGVTKVERLEYTSHTD